MRAAARASASLDAPIGDTDDAVLGDFVAGDDPLPEETVESHLRRQALLQALEGLPEREREVIKLRFGLNGDRDPLPLSQTGAQLGIAPETVREVERRALEHLSLRRELAALRDAA